MALKEARPAGLTTKQLVAATGLSLYQVRKGLLYIREVAAMAERAPLSWSHAGGWRLSVDPADWRAYELQVLHQVLTRVSRLLTSTVAPHAATAPDDEVQALLDQLTAIRSTLNYVLTRTRTTTR
ncbi:FaeA/PapI family transcriptional regulator [Actinomadura kijaniata]|uniref:FaeA/PapI family transcriptional regulator n=1 Tax=Actinomadura kijaniata TaxID=46161 RepID=UPI003F19904A